MNTSTLFFSFLEALQKYDITTFLGAFGFVFLWYNYRKITSSVLKLLTLHEEKHKKQNKTFSKIVDTNNYVLDILNSLLVDISCSRILIMQYHNGGYALNGVDFTKMSCTHEVIHKTSNQKIKPVQTTLLNIPITAYSYFTRQLRKHPTIFVPNIDKIKSDDISTYEEFKRHEAQSFICASLTNRENDLTGFMIFEFSHKLPAKPKENLISVIKHYAIRISGMLESAGVYEENTSGKSSSSLKA